MKKFFASVGRIAAAVLLLIVILICAGLIYQHSRFKQWEAQQEKQNQNPR